MVRSRRIEGTPCHAGIFHPVLPLDVRPGRINGDMDIILWPIQNGILHFSGMDVLPPFIAWSVAYSSKEGRREMLVAYAERLRQIETTAPLDFHPRDDFTREWRLKDGVMPRATGQMGARPVRSS